MSQLAEAKSPRFIARQLALGFASVSVVAIAMCALLVFVIQEVAGLVESMRRDESSIRQGMELATAVREMSVQIANTLFEGDESHLDRYEAWRQQVLSRMQTLSARIPEGERPQLAALGDTTRNMHRLLIESALPAARRGDSQAARQVHRELGRLGEEAAHQADSLALAATRQMSHAHDHATSSTRVGLIGGGLCALLIVTLSVVFTMRLRSVVLRPLHHLTDAALHFGRGDFAFQLGDVGKGELAAVGEAFSRMAAELARREARLLHNERMAAIGQLAAGIAHELNNPIGIIRGYLKTMTPDEDVETLREELAILDEEAGQCQRIADDLLTYARAEELTLERFNMRAFLRETAKRYAISAGAVTVEVDAEDFSVEADSARLRQVLLNLLNNAGQVSPVGGAVRIHACARGDRYQIEVIDQGPGIRPADRHRVFEPFFTRRKGGSGLGLAVCQGIIRAHGGSVEVDDAERGGAIFRLTLPMKPVDRQPAGPAQPAQEQVS